MKNKRHNFLALVAGLGLSLAAGSAFADAAADIKYRQGVFKAVGGHMSSMVAILRGGVHAEDMALHSDSMARLAGVVPTIFPAGSGDGKTEALPEIWEDPEGFKERVDAFVEAARAMGAAGQTGDMAAAGKAVGALGKSCKGCHDNFREEHDD